MSLLLCLFCNVLRNQTSGLVHTLAGLESGENYTFTLVVWSTEGECNEQKDECKFKNLETLMIHTKIGKPGGGVDSSECLPGNLVSSLYRVLHLLAPSIIVHFLPIPMPVV